MRVATEISRKFLFRAAHHRPLQIFPAQYLRSFSNKLEKIDVKLPPLADSIDSGSLSSWEKKIGEFCKVDDTIAIVDTDKVSVDIKAPAAGELVEQVVKEGDEIKVGDIIARLEPKEEPKGDTKKDGSGTEAKTKKIEDVEKPITVEKTEKVQKEEKPAMEVKKSPEKVPEKPLEIPKQDNGMTENSLFPARGTKSIKMTPIRKKTAMRLKSAQNTAATLTTFNEIDMSHLMDLRNKYKDDFLKKHNIKLGFMGAFVVAATKSLLELPIVNAQISGQNASSESGDEYSDAKIVFHDFVDISVAVSSPRGLVVPVLRNCERLTLPQIESQINDLAVKARDNKLSLEDMAGGTFTITNGGVFGSLMSTPMINTPQSAILGMHAIKERPVVVNGKIEVRPMMYVALTYDHRIIDGRESVTFLKSIKEKIEDPARMILEL